MGIFPRYLHTCASLDSLLLPRASHCHPHLHIGVSWQPSQLHALSFLLELALGSAHLAGHSQGEHTMSRHVWPYSSAVPRRHDSMGRRIQRGAQDETGHLGGALWQSWM